ncbi:hypothetical protein EPO66_01425 [bacterium]|nr:MAG: hypothetical protein EPO66_01425 [bacterium]
MRDKLFAIGDKITEYAFYLLLFYIPISKAAVESFAGFIILGFAIKKFSRPDFKFLFNIPNFFLLIFIIFNALSLFNSGEYLAKSLTALCFKWFEYLLVFIIVQDFPIDKKRIRNILLVILFSAFLLSIDGIVQKFTGFEFLRHKEIVEIIKGSGNFAITSSFNHYNDFGAYLIIMLSIVLALISSVDLRRVYKGFLAILGLLLIVCLIFTLSRGAWLGFICAAMTLLIIANQKRSTLIILFIFLSVMVFLPQVRLRNLDTFLLHGDADRFIIWKGAIQMISENPFLGKGVGTFMDHFAAYIPNIYVQYAHNSYLQIWAETGVFSLISFLAFLFFILYSGIKSFREHRNYFLLGIIGGISGFLVHNLFDTHLYSLQLSFIFWVMLGLLAALSRDKHSLSGLNKA